MKKYQVINVDFNNKGIKYFNSELFNTYKQAQEELEHNKYQDRVFGVFYEYQIKEVILNEKI